MNQGYRENELVANRAALLLHGGSEAERRAWAEEAAENFPSEGALVEVPSPAALGAALSQARGVVFIPDVLSLGDAGQLQVLRCLMEKEERPKLVLALSMSPSEALQQGLLRDDLYFRLRQARVDLSDAALKEELRARRAKAEAQRRAQPKPAAKSSAAKMKAGGKKR